MATLRERIQERYPSLVPLLRNHEIGSLLTKAVTENWSPGQFQAKFIASHWFRSQSESQRKWWILSATDPGEARQQRRLMQQAIGHQASKLGIGLTDNQIAMIRERALQMGVSPDDYWVTNTIVRLAKGGNIGTGAWKTTTEQVKALAKGEYFLDMPAATLSKWVHRIVRGDKTMEDLQANLQDGAMHRYAHFAPQLAQGMSLNDIIGHQRQIIADEMEMNSPSAVSMRDPRWRQLLGIRDPKSHKMRGMTDSDVYRLVRSQRKWWDTSHGRQADAAMTAKISEIFGERRY